MSSEIRDQALIPTTISDDLFWFDPGHHPHTVEAIFELITDLGLQGDLQDFSFDPIYLFTFLLFLILADLLTF